MPAAVSGQSIAPWGQFFFNCATCLLTARHRCFLPSLFKKSEERLAEKAGPEGTGKSIQKHSESRAQSYTERAYSWGEFGLIGGCRNKLMLLLLDILYRAGGEM
jgi:hypothetical protein